MQVTKRSIWSVRLPFVAKIILFTFISVFGAMQAVAFLSDYTNKVVAAIAGSVEIEINNQRIETLDMGNVTADALQANPDYAGASVVPNWTTADVNTFSYTVENKGASAVKVENTWYLAWNVPDGDDAWKYAEAYYIYVYPADMDDKEILGDIMNNWAANATVRVCEQNNGECDGDFPTTTEHYYLPGEAETAANYRYGLKFTMPTDTVLDGSNESVPEANGQKSQTHAYKIVFGSSKDPNKLNPEWFVDLFAGVDFRLDVVADAQGVNAEQWTDSDNANYMLTNAQIDPDSAIFPPNGEVAYSLNTSGQLVATITTVKPVTATGGYACATTPSPSNTYECTKTYSQTIANEMVTITASDDGVGLSSDIEIYASPFVTTWSANGSITIPTTGTSNVSVNWGDGTITNYGTTSGQLTHSYASSGTYTVTIYGTMEYIDLYTYATSKDNLRAVNAWGATSTKVYSYGGATNLTYVAMPESRTFAETTSIARLFSGCTSYSTQIPTGFLAGATKLTDAFAAFQQTPNLAGTSIPADLFSYSPELVQVRAAFAEAGFSGQIPAALFANNPKINGFANTFEKAYNLTGTVPAALFANNPEAGDFAYTFASSGITGISAGMFDNNPRADTFAATFGWCGSLVGTIPTGLFANNPNVTDFSYLFAYTGLSGAIPTGLFDGKTRVTTYKSTFENMKSLNGTLPARLFYDSVAVESFEATFAWNENMTGSISADFFGPKPEVTTYDSTFAGTTSLTGTMPSTLFTGSPKATNFRQVFIWTQLSGSIFNMFDHLSSGGAVITGQTLNFEQAFRGAPNLTGAAPALWSLTPTPIGTGCFEWTNFSNDASIPTAWKTT